MSFAETETSANEGSPIDLYLFRFGEGVNDFYGYTNHEQDFDFDDGNGVVTYKAIPIDREEITASGKLEDSTLSVSTAADNSLSALFKDYPPTSVVSLIIRQGHWDDPARQFLVAWSGRVLGFQFIGNRAEFSCEPLSSSLKRVMLRRHYQYGCPHVLYGPSCKAVKAAHTLTRVTVGVNGSVINLPPAWETNVRKPFYKGGVVTWTLPDGRTVERSIIDALTDGQVVLAGPANGLDPGETISISLGCRRTMDDCRDLFNNILNFGGMPWIPLQNPIGVVNNYY